jgi:hypothetical protein
MDEESKETNDVRNREFDEPTLEDKFDKEKLPAVLQVSYKSIRGWVIRGYVLHLSVILIMECV